MNTTGRSSGGGPSWRARLRLPRIPCRPRERSRSRTQNIAKQNARVPADTISMMDVRLGAGVAAEAIRRPIPEPALAVAADEPHEHGVGKPGPGEHG